MTWFEDLTPYSYARAAATTPPTFNVGWLAADHQFPVGDVPASFVVRLAELAQHVRARQMRGYHHCELCPRTAPGERCSAEIRAVGADGTRYAAPQLIAHYVTVHSYRPPDEFIAAVLLHDIPWEHAHANKLCVVCGTPLHPVTLDAIVDPTTGEPAVIALACATCTAEYLPYQL